MPVDAGVLRQLPLDVQELSHIKQLMQKYRDLPTSGRSVLGHDHFALLLDQLPDRGEAIAEVANRRSDRKSVV